MPETDMLQVEKDRLVDGLGFLDGDSEEYKAQLNNLSLIQKLELGETETEMKKRELDIKETETEIKKREVDIKERELDIQSKEPTLGQKVLDWTKAVAPVGAALIGGIFSLVSIRHITKHEKSDDLYYGSKAMSFVKKP